jgi:hypothetical protein
MASKRKPIQGLHAYRLKDSFHATEREFAEAWERQGNTLAYLLGNGRDPLAPSERDAIVAATVIQWLGSNVGQAFLSDLGFKRKAPPND